MKFSIHYFLATGLVCLLFSGCAGYQFGDAKSASLSNIRKLHVPPFKNLTQEPRLSSLVTNAVLKDLQADGTFQISTRSSCDAVLVGVIKHVNKSQLRANRTDTLQSQELSVYLTVEYYLADPVSGSRIGEVSGEEKAANSNWGDSKNDDSAFTSARQGVVVGEAIQFLDPAVSFQVGERQDLAIAAEDLSDKLVSQLANGW